MSRSRRSASMADDLLRGRHRPERWFERFSEQPFKTAWVLLTVVTASLTIVAGVLIRLSDPEHIHSIGEGLWWAVQTVTTVGYGDVVPTSELGRGVGVVVMMTGLAFMTVTTAAVTNLFIEQARRRRRMDLDASPDLAALHARIDDLVGEVRALREAQEDK
jgi:voltage-gated potassium channel